MLIFEDILNNIAKRLQSDNKIDKCMKNRKIKNKNALKAHRRGAKSRVKRRPGKELKWISVVKKRAHVWIP